MVVRYYPDEPDYQEVQNYKEFFVALFYVIPNLHFKKLYMEVCQQQSIDEVINRKADLVTWIDNLREGPIPPIEMNDNKDLQFKIVWRYLYEICQASPIKPTFQEVLFYKNFFLSLQNINLYPKFKQQYNSLFTRLPVDQYLSSRRHLVWWVQNMYQLLINKDLHYPTECFNGGRDSRLGWVAGLIVAVVLGGGVLAWQKMRR
jgi:hypothetical protein